MNKLKYRHLISIILVIFLIVVLAGCNLAYSFFAPVNPDKIESYIYETTLASQLESTVPGLSTETPQSSSPTATLNEKGHYTTPGDVAAYLYTYQKLPSNYITKSEASDLGWESERGNLWDVTDELSIGGDVFGNREGLLPKKSGRIWYECDVNYFGGYRGAERIVYSNDGLIFYTDDHYQTFVQLY